MILAIYLSIVHFILPFFHKLLLIENDNTIIHIRSKKSVMSLSRSEDDLKEILRKSAVDNGILKNTC